MSGYEARERVSARDRLKRAFDLANSVGVLEFELKNLLSSHLCVVSSGTLEECLRLHISEYARLKSPKYIAQFVAKKSRYLTNLTTEKLVGVLRDFDGTLADEINAYMDDRRRSSLNSIISLRHAVAHGKSPGLSFKQVMEYNVVLTEVLDKLDDIFGRIALR